MKEVTGDQEKEKVRYTHVCKGCSHVIAMHTYSFEATDELHIYSMACDLCGTGSDEREWR